MSKSRRWFANKEMTLIGTFTVSPSAKLYPSGYEWRHMETALGRRFAKRELRKFRRQDGKRRINEAAATILETKAMIAAEEQAQLEQERYEDDLIYDYDDYGDTEYGCSCCRPEYDERLYDGAWYGDEAEAAERYREEWRMRTQFETLSEAYWAGYRDAQIGGYSRRFVS